MKEEACNSQFVKIKLPKIFNSAQENCSYNLMSFKPRFRFLKAIVENKSFLPFEVGFAITLNCKYTHQISYIMSIFS